MLAFADTVGRGDISAARTSGRHHHRYYRRTRLHDPAAFRIEVTVVLIAPEVAPELKYDCLQVFALMRPTDHAASGQPTQRCADHFFGAGVGAIDIFTL